MPGNAVRTDSGSADGESPPPACRPLVERLGRLLGSGEVDQDVRLKIIGGCLLLFFHMTFHDWRDSAVSLSTAGRDLLNYAPAPLIDGLPGWVMMDLLFARTYLFVLGMLALLGLFSLLLGRSSLPAMGVLAFLLLNKLYFYLCDFRLFANYHHIHLFFTFIFLFSREKLRFFRVALAVGYLASAVVKLSPSWLFGEYFNALPGKLPFLPKVEGVVTAACVAVVVLEFLGPLTWFTRVRWLRRLSFAGFLVFHLYSGAIVGLFYTTLMLPLVVAAFKGFDEPLQAGFRFRRRHLVPLAACFAVMLGSLAHYAIPGNVRLTAEGRYLGLFMFDSSHAVHFEARIRNGNRTWVFNVYRNWRVDEEQTPPDAMITCVLEEGGRPVGQFVVNEPVWDGDTLIFNPRYFTAARLRISGDPYLYYHYARALVQQAGPDQVSLVLRERLDGYDHAATLIDIRDFEALSPNYRLLRRNEWIQLPGPESPAAYRWP